MLGSGARLRRQFAEEPLVLLRKAAPVPNAISSCDIPDRFTVPFGKQQIPPHSIELQVADVCARSHAHHGTENGFERAPTHAGASANRGDRDAIREPLINVLPGEAK